MLIKEYRVVMPFTVKEYQIGQLFSIGDASLNETGGGEGIEIIRNERFEHFPLLNGRYSKGQYTYKIYHLTSKVPGFIRMLAPKGSLIMHEEAWSAYPYCRTIISNPGYMKDNFYIHIESLHLADNGHSTNVHDLSGDKLRDREVVMIDIANDPIRPDDYKAAEDPTKVKSLKFNRGPLTGTWRNDCSPVMTCYKLVTTEFKWLGLQNRIEQFIQKTERRLFTNFHRQVYCWADRWHSLDIDDIRALEEKVRDDLEKARKTGEVRGMKADYD